MASRTNSIVVARGMTGALKNIGNIELSGYIHNDMNIFAAQFQPARFVAHLHANKHRLSLSL